MNRVNENEWIACVVAELRAACRLPADPMRRGPVPLEHFLAEQSLRLVELPRLSRAGIYDYLLAKGSIPGEMGEDEDLAGFLYITGPLGRVFVNADDPVPRRRFTAGHEFGHFILHRESMGGQVSFGDNRATVIEVEDETAMAMERQANRFAAEILMPTEVCRARAEAFRKTYGLCPRTQFAYHLAAELMVSPEAMRYRLRSLALTDD
jgi:hypothetical protein